MPSRIGETEIRYPTEFAALLMFSWALLLLWGYLKPLERRGVLFLTIIPVNVGIIISGIISVISNIFTLGKVLPVIIVEAALIVLISISLIKTINIEKGTV